MGEGLLRDLMLAMALIFVIEGLLYAIFPLQMRRFMAMILTQSADQLRIAGLVSAVIGVALVWLVRHGLS